MRKRLLAPLTAVLCAQAALAMLYLGRVAAFNAPDEPAHLYYVERVGEGALPVRDAALSPWSYEAAEPPLYYWLAAPLDWPLREQPAPGRVRALRFENVLIGLATTGFVYLLCALIAGERTGVYAAAFSALLPAHLFATATLGNDALAAALSAAALWLGCRLAFRRSGAAEEAAFCAVAALAPLAKASAAVPAACAALFCAARWRAEPRKLAVRALLPAASAAACAGWFYARNARLHGGWLGWPAAPAASGWGATLAVLLQSACARFGWLGSPLPAAVYAGCALAALAGGVGFAAWARRERPWRLEPAWLLVLTSGAASAAFALAEARLTGRAQGRLLLPALGPAALVLVTGWRFLSWQVPASARRWLRRAAGLGLAALHYFAYRAL